jgi:hypothetical protein
VIRPTSLLLLVLGGCGSSCNQPPTPSSETCAGSGQGTVTSLDIGRFDGTTFHAYQDDEAIPLAYGGQGFPMFVLNLRARGSDLGDCLPQTTSETFRGEPVASEGEPLVIHQVLQDTWVSGDELLVSFDVVPGERVQLEATAGGVTSASVNLWVDYVGEEIVDGGAAADAAAPDAGL